MAESPVLELLRREPTTEEHQEIRELWKQHSLAENDRNVHGLLETLTEDCVYELVSTGHRWEGHDGAARFYAGLLSAFPDIDFRVANIVIGPQGVCEEARVTGTHAGDWLGHAATGQRQEWTLVIFFPWDRDRRLFRGERVYVEGLPALTGG